MRISPRLPPEPALDWSAQGAPRARAFDDVYFSKSGGLDEADAVFLAGCGLPEAWAGRAQFALCELGFGAGLNALAVWRAWKIARSAHAILHMVSIEAFPLAKRDAARALAPYQQLAPLSAQLIERWPVRAYGPQRFWFEDDGFVLTLIIDDVARALDAMTGAFGAWFLDGFAPARNPDMWSPPVMKRIAALSAPGARVASYSVAGDVRRALAGAGFAVERKPGFAGKRERLEARLRDSFPPHAGEVIAKRSEGAAIITPPEAKQHPLFPTAARRAKRVAIIGAGIAGAAMADALARRGAETIVLDAALELGAGASGNPAGLVMPRLDRAGVLAELYLSAYLAAIAAYERIGPPAFTPCGVLETAKPRVREAFADLIADPPLPQDWLAAQGSEAALHPRAGLVRPLAAIKAWLKHAQLMCEAPVAALQQKDAAWRLIAPDGRALLAADAVVLACGSALTRLDAAKFLPIEITRGQIEWGPLAAAAPSQARICESYVAPLDAGVLFGATFDRQDGDAEAAPSPAARARNLAALRKLAPDIAQRLDQDQLHSRAALRAAAPDFAPIAGLMPDAPAWLARFADIAHGRKPDLASPAPALEGLYVLGALGARGLTLAPLLAETIASEMFGEPQMLSRRALDAIHPARFLLRQLKRAAR